MGSERDRRKMRLLAERGWNLGSERLIAQNIAKTEYGCMAKFMGIPVAVLAFAIGVALVVLGLFFTSDTISVIALCGFGAVIILAAATSLRGIVLTLRGGLPIYVFDEGIAFRAITRFGASEDAQIRTGVIAVRWGDFTATEDKYDEFLLACRRVLCIETVKRAREHQDRKFYVCPENSAEFKALLSEKKLLNE